MVAGASSIVDTVPKPAEFVCSPRRLIDKDILP
jgi:hypothetical protein